MLDEDGAQIWLLVVSHWPLMQSVCEMTGVKPGEQISWQLVKEESQVQEPWEGEEGGPVQAGIRSNILYNLWQNLLQSKKH